MQAISSFLAQKWGIGKKPQNSIAEANDLEQRKKESDDAEADKPAN